MIIEALSFLLAIPVVTVERNRLSVDILPCERKKKSPADRVGKEDAK